MDLASVHGVVAVDERIDERLGNGTFGIIRVIDPVMRTFFPLSVILVKEAVLTLDEASVGSKVTITFPPAV